MIKLIVAYNNNYAIAENGTIPWYSSEDFKHFKRTTMGCSIIMGYTTWKTLPKQPLPGRLNLVLTRNPGPASAEFPGIYFANDLSVLFRRALMMNPGQDIVIIGGEQIYNLALEGNHVEKVIASEIDDDATGDKFFPNLYDRGWKAETIQDYDGFKVVEFTPPFPPGKIQMVSVTSTDEPPDVCCDPSE